MTRLVNGRGFRTEIDPLPDTPVAECPVAADRYNIDEPNQYEHAHDLRSDDPGKWRDALAYKRGDVLWVKRGDDPQLARVLRVHMDHTRDGDRVAKYMVQLATQRGDWSRVWVYVWPGQIQRGYELATDRGLFQPQPPQVTP